MLGILVHGGNHFIVEGSLPSRDIAIELARYWSLIQIGGTKRPHLDPWRIISKAFREDLTWAVAVPGDGEISPAVALLLEELSSRGIIVHDSSCLDSWKPGTCR